MSPIIIEILMHVSSIILGGLALVVFFYLFKLKERVVVNSFIITTTLTLLDAGGNYFVNSVFSVLPTAVPILLVVFSFFLNLLLVKMLFNIKMLRTLMVGTIGFILLIVIDLVLIYLF